MHRRIQIASAFGTVGLAAVLQGVNLTYSGHHARITLALWYGVGGLCLIGATVLALWRRGAHAPKLSLGEPTIAKPQELKYPVATSRGGTGIWRSIGMGRVVRVAVTNQHGADDAERVYATLRFTDPDGNPEMETQPARWRSKSEDAEITIPGNGREYELDLFARPSNDAFAGCYVWNNESLAAGIRRDEFRCDSQEFLLTVTVRGKHPNALCEKTWRVFSITIPQIVKEGESFPWEP
jgi:hypothetical protein